MRACRTGNICTTFQPYYRFWVEVDDDAELAEGLTLYGAYYVPAVVSDYLLDFLK